MPDGIQELYDEAARAVEPLRNLRPIASEIISAYAPGCLPAGEFKHAAHKLPDAWKDAVDTPTDGLQIWHPSWSVRSAHPHARAAQALLDAGGRVQIHAATPGPHLYLLGIVAGQSVAEAVTSLVMRLEAKIRKTIPRHAPENPRASELQQWQRIADEAIAVIDYLDFDPGKVLAALADERATLIRHVEASLEPPGSVVLGAECVRGPGLVHSSWDRAGGRAEGLVRAWSVDAARVNP